MTNPHKEYLMQMALSLDSPLKEMCREVIESERFQWSPGGSSHHHNYKGGLIEHTAEVTRFANQMANSSNWQMLTAAAIFHDRNKIFEYDLEAENMIIRLPYSKLVGHVVGSYVYFLEQAKAHDLSPELTDQIGHCLLAHHGRHEWRSPVEPQTREAFVLHSADMLSARP